MKSLKVAFWSAVFLVTQMSGAMVQAGGEETKPTGAQPENQAKQKEAEEAAKRRQRNRRWTLVYETKDGSDYLKKLQMLGATLAIPAGNDQYTIIRDLSNPSKRRIEPLDDFTQMYWVDTKPSSVKKLAQALKLEETPSHIAAFFPVKLEQELLQKELEYFRRSDPMGKESDLDETHFTVVPKPMGGYESKVVSQSKRKSPAAKGSFADQVADFLSSILQQKTDPAKEKNEDKSKNKDK
jgi:hypothetical protein